MRNNFLHKNVLIWLLSFTQIVCLYAQEGMVRGRVHNDHENLLNATVYVGGQTKLTNHNGEFSVSLKAGDYELIVTHAGYQKIQQRVRIESGTIQAFHLRMVAVEQLGEVVLLGSRSAVQRSNLNTPVPVDALSSQQLLQTGQVSLMQMLSSSVPSVNASRPIVNEPITLRGLNPDQLLILVNGTRRHNMAIVVPNGIRGVLGNGSVPNDLSSIPFSAIEKIEILRDGASAQYGSDAIAGVINIRLKKSTGKTNIQLQTGQSYLADGKNISLGINHGVSLSKRGFINLSASFRHTNAMYRGWKYEGTVYLNLPPRGSSTDDTLRIRAQDDSIVAKRGFNRHGLSNAVSSEHTVGGFVVNGGYFIGAKTELFWTAMVNNRKSNLLTGYTFFKNAARVNPELFPDGYAAQPYHYNHDYSGIAGVRGETKKGFHWEYTAAYGNNTDDWYVKNTNNPSQYVTLGKNAPTRFYTGTLIFGQLTNNVQVSKIVSTVGNKHLHLSWGAEWRIENFQMKEGEEAAWQHYDSILRRKQGGTAGQVVDPSNVVKGKRNSVGTYMDFEMELSKRFLVDVAGRYEYYSDFGNNLAGKIAARYRISESVAIRSSFNNGFRAPSLQQWYFSFINRSGLSNGVLTMSGTFRNDSYVAKAFGIAALQAERSLNAGVGLTAGFWGHFRLTADAYWIQIKDRIVLGGEFDTVRNAAVKQILLAYPEVNRVSFFSNAINTITRGVDLVLYGSWKIQKGTLLTMLAGNFTQTRLYGKIKTAAHLPANAVNINTVFSRYNRGRLELGQPDSKIILSLDYKIKKFGFLLRTTRFGNTAILSDNLTETADEHFSPKILTDAGLLFSLTPWANIHLGVNNLFDVYPDKLRDYRNTQEGRLNYGLEATPFGFYGGYYFMGLHLNF